MNPSHQNTGVYTIRHIASGKRYVGSAAVNFRVRWNIHRSALRRGVHHSRHLQAAWSKYGEAAFSFEIVETCLPDHAVDVEQVMIDFYKSASREYGYNIAPRAQSCFGTTRSQETRATMSKSMTGLKRSPEARERMKGRKPSPETIEKIASQNRGRKASEETRAKMSAVRTGMKQSDETRKKRSESMNGIKRSAEFCDQMSKRNKGKTLSEETKAKISAANKGLRRSDETRMRMSQAMRLRTPVKHSQKSRELMSAAHRGKPKTEQHKAAMAVGKIRSKMRRASLLLSILPPLGL